MTSLEERAMPSSLKNFLHRYRLPGPTSLLMYGALVATCFVYVSDWSPIVRYIPFYGRKLNDPKRYG
uniref:Uncharacterized protein n=1 Tax=Trichuris muris TaxID=70415 RepID=A0A5S6Q9Q3_TRIMR